MADPNQNNFNDPAKFQEDLAGLNLSKSLSMQQVQEEAGQAEEGGTEEEQAQAQDQEYQERLADETNRQRYVKMMTDQAKAYAKEKAKQAATNQARKFLGKQVAGQAQKTLARVVLTNPIFWIVVVLIFLLIGMITVTIMAAFVACNNPEQVAGGGVKGKVVVFLAETTANFFSPGLMSIMESSVCQYVRVDGGSNSAIQPATGNAPGAGQDLVLISGVPVEGASDPRLRSCMLAHVQYIYKQAQAIGIDFVVTSAYRPGAQTSSGGTSAHSRGEAVDIALRPRGTKDDPVFMKKVYKVMGIAQSAGFVYPQGDTLDEYTKPAENATGQHIHIEYNIPANGKSYCTNPTNNDDGT